ncbi:hypothetical protein NP511_02270 [Natrinema thermotolerans]|uniref:Uncharacterized protein n=1 Tax=Natrinema thermotolerans TaxID=121872 RepID=A0AAF0PEN7_9EURY|nr:hypothetical protein [Natrinema thermotolerans]WPH65884.1 hypothetical protein HJTV4_gp62 [Haloarchaeal virus HJTV-4]QCC60788.1 hypothetical protein DVR14_19955 [Natrinema thermotolerans]QCC61667.1 hypothetical protein DVR14_24095 [Natrinema thermotolerans]WMT07835.1 hypothetical protein NP511_20985 [Natrinema thermotolerans]WMT08467.1 hypothetical protein NP511_02270 [Natrinema thermotolerans]
MTTKFGVSMDDDLAERVEEPLEYGDNRSERVQDLVQLGLAIEDAADAVHVDLPESQREREAFLRQVFIDADI